MAIVELKFIKDVYQVTLQTEYLTYAISNDLLDNKNDAKKHLNLFLTTFHSKTQLVFNKEYIERLFDLLVNFHYFSDKNLTIEVHKEPKLLPEHLYNLNEVVERKYHSVHIPKGQLGEITKIEEELLELKDSINQKVKIMELCEISDLYGAIEAYVNKHHPEITMNDIISMSNKTKYAFGHKPDDKASLTSLLNTKCQPFISTRGLGNLTERPKPPENITVKENESYIYPLDRKY